MQTAESMVHSQVEEGLYRQFGQDQFTVQLTADSILTLWVPRSLLSDVLRFLKPQFSMLYDLFAIDERTRENRAGQPAADYTVVYQLLSMDRNDDMLPYIEDGTIHGAVAQKSYIEAFLAVHMLHWQNTDGIKVVPDWRAAGINPLPETVDTGVMPITAENVGQFKHV